MQQRFSAMVLAAGYGTRLAPLTDEIPKPLVPIRNVPLLGRILEKLLELRASEVLMNTHYRYEDIVNYISSLPFNVHVSHEEKILGTAGGVRRATSGRDIENLILVNGDIDGQLPVPELMQSSVAAALTLAVVPRPLGTGTVGIGSQGQVVRLRGELFGTEVRSGDYMGCARLQAKCLATLPEEGCLIGDWALPVLRSGGQIGVVNAGGDFVDIGSPQAYLQANLRNVETSGVIAQEVTIDAGVQLVRCVVGRGARLSGTGLIEDSVILPGAAAQAPLRRAIVCPSGTVLQVPEAKT